MTASVMKWLRWSYLKKTVSRIFPFTPTSEEILNHRSWEIYFQMKQAQGHPYHVSSDLVNRNKVGKYFHAAFVNSSFLWFSPNLCWCQHKYFEENHLRLILLVRADRVNLRLVFNRLQTLQEKQKRIFMYIIMLSLTLFWYFCLFQRNNLTDSNSKCDFY